MRPVIEHWDGVNWSIVDSPELYGTLYDVRATSSSNAWAVGYQQGQKVRGLVEHWDGVSWTAQRAPAGEGSRFYGVAAGGPTDAWAVGAGPLGSLTDHWDGVRWSTIPPPAANLYSVAEVAPDDVWAVGLAGLRFRPVAAHWDGIRWSLVPTLPLPPGATEGSLQDVTATSSQDVWAVGYFSSAQGKTLPLVEHWDGTAWSLVQAPVLGSLNGVFALSAGETWVVGSNIGATPNSVTEHWDGLGWTPVRPPNPNANSALIGVTELSPRDVWAVGATIGTPLIEHFSAPCPLAR